MASTRLVATVALGLVVSAPTNRASADEWLIVPVTREDNASALNPTVDALTEELARRGISIREGNEAASHFEEQVSMSPPVIGGDELAAWQERSRTALGLLARNDYEGALAELEQAQALSRAAVTALNRDKASATTLLNTCLYGVRALLAVGKRATARVQAEECARLSPALDPDVRMHPPNVRTFYEDVIEAGRSTGGTLVVESQPAGCAVRMNGVEMGRSPAHIDRLTTGRYAVQVECAEHSGRIHGATVERGAMVLRIDARLDAAIRTDALLSLRYAEWNSPDQSHADARALIEVLSVDAILLVSATADDAVELTLVESGHQEARTAFARPAEADPNGRTLAAALYMLLGVAPATPTRPPRGQFIAGATLAAFGTASLLTGYALYGLSATKLADDMVASPTNGNQAQWLNTRAGMYYVGSAGAATLVAAMPLALPYREKTPWWGWLSGGAGLALAATSIALAVKAPSTPSVSRVADPQGYADRAKRTDAAFLSGVTAAPLLAIPLVYLLRRDDKRSRATLTPKLVVARTGGFAGVEGRF